MHHIGKGFSSLAFQFCPACFDRGRSPYSRAMLKQRFSQRRQPFAERESLFRSRLRRRRDTTASEDALLPRERM
jgi:hypothetical protein